MNRVEADELSYGLHIMIRTDLEIDLLERGLSVEDLPNEWNKRYLNLLGVSPKNDTEGCLQDVHWSEGMFGYFPSYLLGHIISAQLTKTLSESKHGPSVLPSAVTERCSASIATFPMRRLTLAISS